MLDCVVLGLFFVSVVYVGVFVCVVVVVYCFIGYVLV